MYVYLATNDDTIWRHMEPQLDARKVWATQGARQDTCPSEQVRRYGAALCTLDGNHIRVTTVTYSNNEHNFLVFW
jgi:hypothetical protein